MANDEIENDIVVENGDKETKLYIKRENGEYEPASATDIENEGYVLKDNDSGSAFKECDYCFELVPKKAIRCKHCQAGLTKKSAEQGENFVVLREEAWEEFGGFKTKVSKIHVTFKDQQMINILKCYLENCQELFEKEPKVSAEELFTILPLLRQEMGNYYSDDYCLKPVIDFLEKEFEEQERKFENLKSQNLVVYEMLRYLFPRGTKFFSVVDGQYKVASAVQETSYIRSNMGNYFSISGEVIKSNGDQFFINNHSFYVNQFKGAKRIEDLNIQPLDGETLKELTERGKLFNQIGTGSKYMEYKGPMLYKTRFYKTQWKADGRVMIDGTSFNKMNAEYEEFQDGPSKHSNQYYRQASGSKEKNLIKDIPEDQWFKCWHTLGGFSFRTKKWGEILVEKLSHVEFDDGAFDRLVLPVSRKKLIHSLILNSSTSFSDIISGKGAGCIFLLHGPPGTGKTLTAEAVAELLHRPLYSISVGELGVETERLEQTLRDILDVASVWDAVILIDEADIFLEKRTDNGIKRNALVGVFLRLLEYHQGILFLTTNRVKRFDEAFHSRISIALQYPSLSEESRKQIWSNLLAAANAPSSLPVDKLAKYNLNGRQIRTTIRLGQSLAKGENEELSITHFEQCIEVATQFQNDLITTEE